MKENFEDDLYEWLDEYECYECGATMNQVGEVLVCPRCGHSVDVDDWITEAEDYEDYYPTAEEFFGNDENDEDDEEDDD